jgi:hypothetical protein
LTKKIYKKINFISAVSIIKVSVSKQEICGYIEKNFVLPTGQTRCIPNIPTGGDHALHSTKIYLN